MYLKVNGIEFFKVTRKCRRISSDFFIKKSFDIQKFKETLDKAGFYELQIPLTENDVMCNVDWIGHYIYLDKKTYFFENKEDFFKASLMFT